MQFSKKSEEFCALDQYSKQLPVISKQFVREAGLSELLIYIYRTTGIYVSQSKANTAICLKRKRVFEKASLYGNMQFTKVAGACNVSVAFYIFFLVIIILN